MKSVYFTIAIAMIIGLTSCSGSSNNKRNSPVHEDGSVHENHSHSTECAKPTEQETFKVEADSCDSHPEEHHEHSHSGHSHKH
jgi:hypothetical protein